MCIGVHNKHKLCVFIVFYKWHCTWYISVTSLLLNQSDFYIWMKFENWNDLSPYEGKGSTRGNAYDCAPHAYISTALIFTSIQWHNKHGESDVGGRGGRRFTCNNCCTRYEQNRALDDLVCTILPTNVLQRNGGGVYIIHIVVLKGLMQYDEYNRRKLITLSYSLDRTSFP